jgi:hypothetical protein
MAMLISIALVLSIWIIAQQVFLYYQKSKRQYFSTISSSNPSAETIREIHDKIPLVIMVDKPWMNFYPQQNHRSLGRLVVTEHWMCLACNDGLLLNESKGGTCKVSVLGPKRMVIIGKSPNKEVNIRIELTIDDEAKWAGYLQRLF